MTIPTRTVNALRRAGLTPDNALHMTIAELLRIPQIGPEGIYALAKHLNSKGDKT